jgi:hypothetical protein
MVFASKVILRVELLFLFFLWIRFVVRSKMLLHHLQLSRVWSGMYLSIDLGVPEEIVITLHELSSSFFIQTALREWNNQ